jgi:hypothetical protein
MIKGVLKFQPPIFVHDDVLGQNFKTNIGQVCCELFFPKTVKETKSNPIKLLNPPCEGKDFNINFWGQMNYPASGFSCVENVIIFVESGEGNAEKVYSEINLWWKNFYTAVILTTKQRTAKLSSITNDPNHARLQLFEHNSE